MAWLVENLPAVRETQVRSLGGKRSPGEANGNPLQYSCLGNPMVRGAWQDIVHGVAKELNPTWRLNHHVELGENSEARKQKPTNKKISKNPLKVARNGQIQEISSEI